jgi:hypothetical protein
MLALKYLMDEIRSVILLTFLSAIGGLLFGYDTGVVSGAMLLIEEDSRIEADTVWKELIVSATVRVNPNCKVQTVQWTPCIPMSKDMIKVIWCQFHQHFSRTFFLYKRAFL